MRRCIDVFWINWILYSTFMIYNSIVIAMSSDVWWRTIRYRMLYDAVCALTIEEWLFSRCPERPMDPFICLRMVGSPWTRCKDIKMIQEAIMMNDRSGIHVFICPQQKACTGRTCSFHFPLNCCEGSQFMPNIFSSPFNQTSALPLSNPRPFQPHGF